MQRSDLLSYMHIQLTPNIPLPFSSALSVRSVHVGIYRVIFLIPKCNGLLTGSGTCNSDIVSSENS